jgi:tripartite-type tricarboxylate transporter receptor subunit TctC
VAAPAKMPRKLIDKLHGEIQKALAVPSVQDKLARLGVEQEPLTVDQFAKFVNDDMAGTLKLAKDAHLEPTD